MTRRTETPQSEHRRLMVTLRQAREARQLTQKDVADSLEWSASKLIRIERGTVGISITDLKALLLHYDVTDAEEVDRMVEMARASKKAAWWQEYREVLPQDFVTFIGLEASAVRIKQFHGMVIPGLLQSPDYVKALLGLGQDTPDQARLGLEVRLKRQELISEFGPECSFIIDESVLYRTVGDNAVMRGQLLTLKEFAARPRVAIRILPFSAGVHRSMKNYYEILELSSEPDDYVLLVDQAYKDQLLQVPNDETRLFVSLFGELAAKALSAEDTLRVIDQRLKEIEKD
jgi:transcriptional regulator with XRE-family HTH domain